MARGRTKVQRKSSYFENKEEDNDSNEGPDETDKNEKEKLKPKSKPKRNVKNSRDDNMKDNGDCSSQATVPRRRSSRVNKGSGTINIADAIEDGHEEIEENNSEEEKPKPKSRKPLKGKETSAKTIKKKKAELDEMEVETNGSLDNKDSKKPKKSRQLTTSRKKVADSKKDQAKNETPKINEINAALLSEYELLSQPSTSKEPRISSKKKSSNKNVNSDSDGDDSEMESDDWEEVEEAKIDDKEDELENYKPQLPDHGVQITLDGPKIFNKKRSKKQVNVEELLRKQLNSQRKENQIFYHKIALLCLLARGFYLNRLTYHPLISSLSLSYLTDFTFDLKKVSLLFIKDFSAWFRSWFTYEKATSNRADLFESLTKALESRVVQSQAQYVITFLAFLRVYSPKIQCRLVYALNPCSIKPDNLIMTEKQRCRLKNGSSKDDSDTSSTREKRKSDENVYKKPSNKLVPSPKKEENKKEKEKAREKEREIKGVNKARKRKNMSDDDDDDFDADFDEKAEKPKGKGKMKAKKPPVKRAKNSKIISSDDDDDILVEEVKEVKNHLEYWVEVYVDTEERWVCIDVMTGQYDMPNEIEKKSYSPLLYAIAWDNYSLIKDVTQRYSSDWGNSKFRRSRVEDEWWLQTLSHFRPRKKTRQEKQEDAELDEIFADRPMPASLSDFKNHPLYILKKHLLKYEVIYPPDAPPLSFFRGEPVYARECVKDVHSREYWMRQARVVRPDEAPYKISVKRKKWDRNLGDFLRDLPLELFGEWQTDPYIPPEAKDGKVPRNNYGNVELFQPCMLPKGTVHLQLPGLIRIANKLKIDCAPAVTGFDNCAGGAGVHPVFDGFVVCEEFADVLEAAWEEEQMNIKKREIERREKRVYGNWKRLIKGVLIREQLRLKYNREHEDHTGGDEKEKINENNAKSLEIIEKLLSQTAKRKEKRNQTKKSETSTKKTKTSSKKKSKRSSSQEEDDDEDDHDLDDFIVDDDDDDEIDEESEEDKLVVIEEEAEETETESD